MMHISALSPCLFPSLMMRVYPPGLSPTLVATSLNNSETAYLSRKFLNTILLEWVESSFERVMIGSTKVRSSLAFAVVVVIRLCKIREDAILASIAFLCALVLLR